MEQDKLAKRVENLFEGYKAYLGFILNDDIENFNAKLKLYDALNNGEINEIRISRPEIEIEETSKENVITELLKRIAILEYEVERQDNILEEVNNYLEKMSYCSIVDNPKKDLQKILKKENKND